MRNQVAIVLNAHGLRMSQYRGLALTAAILGCNSASHPVTLLLNVKQGGSVMAAEFRRQYWAQLPKPKRLGLLRIVEVFGALASILSLTLGFYVWNELERDEKYIYSLGYFLFIILILLIYILIRELNKTHRYSESVFYMHFVNHVIRDYISEKDKGSTKRRQEVLADILDAIAACFSVVKAKYCSASVWELVDSEGFPHKFLVQPIARDGLAQRVNYSAPADVEFLLESNTEFRDIWYGTNNCIRYYLEGDISKAYRQRRFESSRLEYIKSQNGIAFLLHKKAGFWPLPYKSTIVAPIRCFNNYSSWFDPRETAQRQKGTADDENHFWGFLKIECSSSNVFDTTHAPEVLGAFADALYILFISGFTDSQQFGSIVEPADVEHDIRRVTQQGRVLDSERGDKRS